MVNGSWPGRVRQSMFVEMGASCLSGKGFSPPARRLVVQLQVASDAGAVQVA